MPNVDRLPEKGPAIQTAGPRDVVISSVTGYSMWPTLRSGQVLRAEYRSVRSVRAGDIVAYSKNGNMVVHRLMRILAEDGEGWAVIRTCGDRSGPDEPVSIRGNILAVTHVLNRGDWVRVRSGRPSSVFRMLPARICRLMQSAASRIIGLVERRRSYDE